MLGSILTVLHKVKKRELLQGNCYNLIGNCAYIFRANSKFTQCWYDELHKVLNDKLEFLKKNPAKSPIDRYRLRSTKPILRQLGLARSEYPLTWTEILGDIFHPLCYEFSSQINKELPSPDFSIKYR